MLSRCHIPTAEFFWCVGRHGHTTTRPTAWKRSNTKSHKIKIDHPPINSTFDTWEMFIFLSLIAHFWCGGHDSKSQTSTRRRRKRFEISMKLFRVSIWKCSNKEFLSMTHQLSHALASACMSSKMSNWTFIYIFCKKKKITAEINSHLISISPLQTGLRAFHPNWHTSDAARRVRDGSRLHIRDTQAPANDHIGRWQAAHSDVPKLARKRHRSVRRDRQRQQWRQRSTHVGDGLWRDRADLRHTRAQRDVGEAKSKTTTAAATATILQFIIIICLIGGASCERLTSPSIVSLPFVHDTSSARTALFAARRPSLLITSLLAAIALAQLAALSSATAIAISQLLREHGQSCHGCSLVTAAEQLSVDS